MKEAIDFESIFRFLPGNYIILAPDAPKFTIVTFNDARAEQTFTYTNQIGKGIFEAFPDNPDDPDANGVARLRASLENVMREKKPHEMAVQKYDILTADRSRFEERYWLPRNVPVLDTKGEIQYIIHHVQDVTSQVLLRKKAEVYQLNKQVYELFMQAPMGICVSKGEDHVIVMANAPVLELWGKDASVIGKPLLKAMPELEGQGFVELLTSVKEKGEAFYANERIANLVRNGKPETIYLNFVYQPYYEEDGTISGVIAIAVDVTEQVVARKQVEYTGETARLAIESADLGAYEISLVTDEMITTPRFNAIWGFERTVPRSAFAQSIHPDDRELRLAAHAESLQTGKLFYECRIFWPDTSIHWIRINGTVLYDADHKPVRLLGVIKDITKEKAFAEEMTRLVQEKTRELQRSNERLEKSNSELEQFAYITSHDLQEPLRKIQIYNTMILDKAKPEDGMLNNIKKIASSATRMSGLIKDLLEYSRLSHANIEFVKVDLEEILQNVLSDFELLITQKKAVIESDTLGTIEAIPLQMNQLFSNLVGNALKFAKPDTPPLIRIKASPLSDKEKASLAQLSQERKYYKITVSDNGIGFDQAYSDRIFSVFQRLNQTSEYMGYGIGLSLCSKVVANHQGTIYAEGVQGVGASFTVVLPYVQEK